MLYIFIIGIPSASLFSIAAIKLGTSIAAGILIGALVVSLFCIAGYFEGTLHPRERKTSKPYWQKLIEKFDNEYSDKYRKKGWIKTKLLDRTNNNTQGGWSDMSGSSNDLLIIEAENGYALKALIEQLEEEYDLSGCGTSGITTEQGGKVLIRSESAEYNVYTSDYSTEEPHTGLKFGQHGDQIDSWIEENAGQSEPDITIAGHGISYEENGDIRVGCHTVPGERVQVLADMANEDRLHSISIGGRDRTVSADEIEEINEYRLSVANNSEGEGNWSG